MSIIRFLVNKPWHVISVVALRVLLLAFLAMPVLAAGPSGSISGTVKDIAGNPLASISINTGGIGRTLTDAGGNYLIKDLPFNQYSVVSPGRWGNNDGNYISQTREISISANSPVVTGVDFVLEKGGSIAGTVKDPTGTPLSNVSVSAGGNFRVLTDAKGAYVARGLPFGQYTVVIPGRWGANDGTYISQAKEATVTIDSPDVSGIDFVLEKGGSIAGTVKDATDNPLANVSVNAGDNYRTLTDASGNYVIKGLPFDQYQVVSPGRWGTNDSTYLSQSKDITVTTESPDVSGIDFVLEKGGSIAGTVRDATGNPLANVSVNAGENYRTLTDASGNYAIKGLPFGQYSVVSPARFGSNDSTYISQSKTTAVIVASPDVGGIDFALEKGGSIAGTVKDATGSPLANVSVNAGGNYNALTDASGNYAIKGLPFDQYAIVSPVRWGGGDSTYISQSKDTIVTVISPDVTGIDFVLEKGGSVAGTVKDGTGNPMANFSINAGDNYRTLTDVNGNYAIKGLPFDQYTVVSPGRWGPNDGTYISQSRDIAITTASPDVTGIDFELENGGSVAGIVKDGTGNPMANISINAGDNYKGLTDASGNYVIKGLPFGQYTVISPGRWGSDDSTYISQRVNIAINTDLPDVSGINFFLEKGGSIAGIVRDADGRPLDHISVNAGEFGGALTDVNGNYVIKGLPFGQYTVVSPGRFGSADGTYISQNRVTAVTTASPDVGGTNFYLEKGGSIAGTVKDATGSPLANIGVNAGGKYGALTDDNGTYVIKGLPFDQYTVVSPGNWGGTISTYISQSRDTAVNTILPDVTGIDFVLEKGGSIAGTVKDATGSPLSNISVKIGDKYETLTADNGTYFIKDLPFGHYSVVLPAGMGKGDGKYARQTRDIVVSADLPEVNGIDFGLVATWYKQDMIIVIIAVICGALILLYIVLCQKHKLQKIARPKRGV
jgi:uncharacterized protein (UPF0371 family)